VVVALAEVATKVRHLRSCGGGCVLVCEQGSLWWQSSEGGGVCGMDLGRARPRRR
jgi:hypothetical protein